MASELVATAAPTARKRGGLGRKIRIWGATLVAVLLLLGAALLGIGATTGDHTLGSVAYAQIPPNSGDHSPVWQRCGFYLEPVGNEHAVHSLEHGAVWITFRPDLPQAQVDVLRAAVQADDELFVSPYPDLPAPVVISAWGRQVQLEAVDDVRLEQALREIRDALEAPEPGGGCDGPNLWLSGGTGDPEA
jgi:hypothetical protein